MIPRCIINYNYLKVFVGLFLRVQFIVDRMNTVVISVIIVNYNGGELIRHSIECLMKQTYEDFEVIVVDNASGDHSVQLIQDTFPSVRLIKHKNNSGFSGGNILGLKQAKGDYIALLNSDAFPEPNWLESLLEGIQSDKAIGICASKLIIDGTDLIDSAGDGCTTASRAYKQGENEPHSDYNKMKNVFGACGGAVLYRRSMIDKIGFFDEDFFIIYEDADLNFRAQLAGWKCLYVPKAVVHHRVRSTIGQDSPLAVFYSNRNTDLMWIKNMPFPLMLRYLHHKIISEIGSFIYFAFRKRLLLVFIKAKCDVIRLLPRMLKKRKQVQALKKISNEELAGMLTPILSKHYFLGRLQKLWQKQTKLV